MAKKKKIFHFDDDVDFHGYTREEAIRELEELVFTSSSKTLLIIHGKGTGVLKNAVRAFVRKSQHIKSYEFGENINLPGGDGVTIIYT
ncbi:MAG: Smr/MutS family protein [Victivallaceae bacterium]|nr:Smr/MutS family protein [Victivallaceae bacterium]